MPNLLTPLSLYSHMQDTTSTSSGAMSSETLERDKQVTETSEMTRVKDGKIESPLEKLPHRTCEVLLNSWVTQFMGNNTNGGVRIKQPANNQTMHYCDNQLCHLSF